MLGKIHRENGFPNHRSRIFRVDWVRAAARRVGMPGPSREIVEMLSLRGVVYLELD